MRPAFTVLRIQKLKTWGAIGGSGKHNQRERETPNADSARTAENRTLVGNADSDNVTLVKEAIGTQLIRKNAVLGVEMLLSASPEYFRPGQTEKAGEYDAHRLNSWVDASTQWLKERYGNRVVKAVLHLDEATPHVHALLVPLDDTGKLNCRALFGGSRHTLALLQTDYADAVKSLGITRGIENSRATHQKVSQFYSIIGKERLAEIPKAQRYDAPELPSKLNRMSDKVLVEYARAAAQRGSEAQRAATESVVNAVKSENEILKQQHLALKDINAHLHKENTTLQEYMKVLRGVELGAVLKRLFNAKGPYPKDDRDCYRLPDQREVLVNNSSWRMAAGKSGKGTIDLVMVLRGYEQKDLNKALGELGNAFGVNPVAGEYAGKFIERAQFEVGQAVNKHVLICQREERECNQPQEQEYRQPQQPENSQLQEQERGRPQSQERQQPQKQIRPQNRGR